MAQRPKTLRDRLIQNRLHILIGTALVLITIGVFWRVVGHRRYSAMPEPAR